MIRALYSAASGMSAQEMAVDNIAHNLSNSNKDHLRWFIIKCETIVGALLALPDLLCPTLCLTSRLGFNEVNIFEHGKLLLFALLEFHGDNNACCKPGHLLSPHAFGAGIRTLRSLLPHPNAVCAVLIFLVIA